MISGRELPNAARPASPDRQPTLTRAERFLALLVVPAVLAVAWVSQLVHPTSQVHAVAQFVHLASVVVGFGSVLAVDWFGLRWQFGLSSLERALTAAGALAAPIWFGLMGLLLSGVFLQPDLSATITRVKIGLVAGAGLIGVAAVSIKRQMSTTGPPRPPWLVRRALLLALASQVCWWGATVIGFLNRTV